MAGLFAGAEGAGAAGAAGSGLLGGGTGASALLGATTPFITEGMMAGATPFVTEAVAPFAAGATTAAPGMAAAYGPQAAQAAGAGWKMTPKQAMLLAQMTGAGQQPERPMGGPVDMGNPMQRPAMMTQEQITKKWLLENDPNTYARIYGSPQPMGA
jgi:hypothetical protein